MPDRDAELQSRIGELVAMVDRLRAALQAISQRETDPKAMKVVADQALSGLPPPPAAKTK